MHSRVVRHPGYVAELQLVLPDVLLEALPYSVMGGSNIGMIDIFSSDHEVEETRGFRGSQADSGTGSVA